MAEQAYSSTSDYSDSSQGLCSMAEQASSSTSDYSDSCTYDVFLSFRGDTRKTFTDHLYKALKNEGFCVFRDKDDAESGKSLSLELKKAIQLSKSSIIVFSKGFASSTWCLNEVVMILDRARTSRHFVQPVFYDVDPSEVRKQTESFATSFARYEEQIEKESDPRKKEELMDKVKEWRKALEEVADLKAKVLKNEVDGYESEFIERIIKVMRDNVILKVPKVKSSQIGIKSRAAKVISWLQNGSTDVDIMVMCGMSGIGKTIIARYVFDLAFGRFGRNRFFENVSEISKEPRGFIQLREKLVPYYWGKNRKRGTSHEDNGPPVFIVLDDVVNKDQLDAIPIMKECFHPGSKIIIVTTNMQLSRHYKVEYKVGPMYYGEALVLFSWHAFGQDRPIEGYMDHSKTVVNFCEGHPLALKVLGSSLCAQTKEVWISQLMKFKAIPNSHIQEKLKVGYDRLRDDYNRDLFLEIACFFVGMDKDYVVAMLEKFNFYSTAGIQDLVDRCLLTINRNKFEMHKLLQQMGREIVRQQSPKCLGERSRLWQYEDSFRVLEEKSGTKTIEGLALNMKMLEKDKDAMESLNIENSKEATLDTDAFTEMRELRVLQIDYVQLLGGYKEFPKNLRWLCWHGFPLKCLPSDFPMKNLVAIDMRNSSLEKVWEGAKSLPCLKFLDLTDCHALTETPDFSKVPKLLNLILEGCANLVHIHESIEKLRKLVVLNLKGCKSLKKLPGGIGKLKSVKTFETSGCSNLENFPMELREMESLEVLKVKGIDLSRRPMVTLPCSLKRLSLDRCNLSDCDFPKNLSSCLPFLTYLSIAENPICSLPDFVKGLDNLFFLGVSSCQRLQTLTGVPPVGHLSSGDCRLLKKITYGSSLAGRLPEFVSSHCENLLEVEGYFKLEPLANFDAKMINNLGLLNVESLRSTEVVLFGPFSALQKKLPIQVLFQHEEDRYEDGYDAISIFLPGRNNWNMFSNQNAWRSSISDQVLVGASSMMAQGLYGKVRDDWFPMWDEVKAIGSLCGTPNTPRSAEILPWRLEPLTISFQNAGRSSISFKNAGRSSISFIVPEVYNLRAQKLSIGCVYSNTFERYLRSHFKKYIWRVGIRIYNKTEKESVYHRPYFFGIPEPGKRITWLSHFNLNLKLEPGNRLLIKIQMDDFEVEELGVQLAYDEQEPRAARRILRRPRPMHKALKPNEFFHF